MKKLMTEGEIREKLYDIFPVLVFEEGLSIMEATSFALTFEIGLGPADAAKFTSKLMNKKVRTTDIGSYVARAQTKLLSVKDEEFDPENAPDPSEYEVDGVDPPAKRPAGRLRGRDRPASPHRSNAAP